MATNREWLYSLDVADLAEWFDSDHVDNNDELIAERDELQEGDAVALLRDWLDYKINRFDAEANAIILNTGADPGKLYEIADMVERDYVLREECEGLEHANKRQARKIHDVCEANSKLKAERDELQRQLDTMRDVTREFRDERDGWKAKAEQAERAMNKAAGKWARVESRSAQRAAAVERLKSIPPMDTSATRYVRAILGSIAGMTAQDVTRELIDLLTDDDANDDSAPENDVSADDVDANDANATQDMDNGECVRMCPNDSREKLEDDIQSDLAALSEYGKLMLDWYVVMDWLDRQAAITKAEQREWWGGVVAELQAKVDELTAERDYWKREVEMCMKSAYPPSHSPERSYNPDVMAYPDRSGCTTPSTLVSAMIDGLRDERSAQYMALLEELAGIKADLKACQGQLKTERNNFEQATGARDYWREKLSLVLHRLKELGCEVGGINDVPITVELPSDDEGLA